MPSGRLRGPSFPLGDTAENQENPDLRPRELSGTRRGAVNERLVVRRRDPLAVRRSGSSIGCSCGASATPGWWPGEIAVRGVRRRDPRPEHGLDERGEGARRCCAPRACSRSTALDRAHRRRARAARPLVGHLSGQGAPAAGVPRLPRVEEYGGRVEAMAARPAAALREAARGARHRPRDRRLDRALRRRRAAVRRRRLHAARVRAARAPRAATSPTTRCRRLSRRRLPRGRRALQRLPRAARAAGKEYCRPRPLCDACPLARVCVRRGVSGALRAAGGRCGRRGPGCRSACREGAVGAVAVHRAKMPDATHAFFLAAAFAAAPPPRRTSGSTGATAGPS